MWTWFNHVVLMFLTSHLLLSGHQYHHHLHCSYSSFQTLPFSPLHIQIYHNSQSTLFGFFLNFETTLCSCSWSSEAFTGFSNSFDPGLQKGAEGCKQRFTVQWKVWQIVNLHLGLHTYSLCFVYSHTLACINPVKRTWIQCSGSHINATYITYVSVYTRYIYCQLEI